MILALAISILLIGLLVFVHEAGHFFAAKFFKVKVEEFGFGFPPRIWGKRKGETIYSINAIPAGGFVRLFGEEGEHKDNPRSFSSKGPWVRSLIIASGVALNLVVAFILFTVLLTASGFRVDIPLSLPTGDQNLNLNFPFGSQANEVLVLFVQSGTPAEKAGFKQLDVITSAQGQQFTKPAQFRSFIQSAGEKELVVEVYNVLDKQSRRLTVAPQKIIDEEKERFEIGVFIDEAASVRYKSTIEKIFVGPAHSANMVYYQANAMAALISKSLVEKSAAPVTENVRGPVGIVALIGAFIGATGARGVLTLVETIALLSLILAVINILPIPALDGGRLFFTLVEGVTRRKINPAIERFIHAAGFSILIILFLLITYNDIVKIFS